MTSLATTIGVLTPLVSLSSCTNHGEDDPEVSADITISEDAKFLHIFSQEEEEQGEWKYTFTLEGTRDGDIVTIEMLNETSIETGEEADKIIFTDAIHASGKKEFVILANGQKTLDIEMEPKSDDPFQEAFDVSFDFQITIIRPSSGKTICSKTMTVFEFDPEADHHWEIVEKY